MYLCISKLDLNTVNIQLWADCTEPGSADGNLGGTIFLVEILVLKLAHFGPKHFTSRNLSRKRNQECVQNVSSRWLIAAGRSWWHS